MQKNKIINRSIFISIVHSLLLIFFISASIAQIDNKEFDRKLFQVLEKEYSAASRVFKQKRNASNAFRLFSIQMELLKLVKSKHVELSLKSSNPASYMNNQKSRGELYKSYKSTIGLAKYIENNYKSFPDIGKFYFLYGLSIYEFDEKSSEVGRTLEKSIKLMRDNELLHLARGRLGDYYFNVGNFRAAATNYFEALRLDNNSEWKYRYHHNLAWSYFKSQELGRAIDTLKLLIKKASAAKDTTDYFYSQAVKKLPFFYVYANKPDEGYQFVKDYSGVEGRELFEFLQITYEKGFFDRLDFYIVDVEKILTSMKKEQALLEFRIAIHNYIAELDYKKNNELMARLRSGIVEAHRKNPMPEESKKSFVNNIKRMVNENISVVNRPAFDYKNKLDKEILDDTVEMLKIVMDIDNKDAAGNRLKLAQLYRKGNRAEEALQLLLTDYQKMSQDNSPASIKILEEMLVISEQIKPENSKINIEQIYQDYLKKGDDPKIRSSVFLKMFDIKFAKKDLITSFELTKKFGKEFPNQTEPLKKMISKILAQSFATNETKMTNQVRSYALTIPAIKNDAKFMKDLRTSQQSVDFNEINAGLGGKQNSSISEKNKSAETLREIYQDGLIDRSNRLVAGFNAAIMFVDLGRVSDANVIFGSLLSEYDQKEFSDYQERIVTVAETQVVLGQESFSTPILESIYAKNCKFNLKQKSDFYIKLAEIYTLRSDYDKLINHVAQGDKCQVSSESKSSVYRLVNEYVDFNKKDEVVSFFALLNKKIINSQTEIDRAVENWIILKINEVAVINQSTLKKIYDELYKMMSGKTSSRVLQEYTEVVGTYGAQVPYEKMPLTVEKFQVFVEKNVNNFNRNISVYANRKYTYSVTKYLNALLEVNTIERFLNFWKVVPSLVVKKEETQEYVKQINEFLLPYQDKYKQLSKGLDIALDQGALLIRHRKLEDATNLKFRPKRPLLRNVGDL